MAQEEKPSYLQFDEISARIISFDRNVTEVEIPEGVTSIGKKASFPVCIVVEVFN